ncbi:MAG: PTS system mannose/fructose/sorbose family transporter subunit IID [Ruminococcaceae bacterium]|nr:PTS system mannose/fructose/sorbose family transporter subunit IID [Oscillospiraceae bacterium]
MSETAVKKESKLTTKDLWIVFWRWWWACEMSNSYERMQSVSYCFAMIPVLKKLYTNKEDLVEALQRHLVFFNTEGNIGMSILGISVGMEEEKSVSSLPGDAIISVKTGLMGPVAGIGDSLIGGAVRPLIFSLALTASANGSVIGVPIMFLYVVVTVILGWFLMCAGYRLGKDAVASMLESGWINRIITGASVLGLFMMGALSATTISLKLAGSYMSAGQTVTIQSVLDGLIPGLLPLIVVMAIYLFFKKKGQKFLPVIITIIAGALLLSLLGIV